MLWMVQPGKRADINFGDWKRPWLWVGWGLSRDPVEFCLIISTKTDF